ncbi:MAG TPA: LPS export ABC transporter permease LptG [Methylomirabilota bacterium]
MRRPLIPVIDRYLVRELLTPFGLGCGLFTFFLVIDRIYHLTDLVITKGVPFHLVLQLLVFMLPSFLAHTLPMALLVAVLLAGGRLAGDMEVVAFKAAGVSVLRLFRPILLASLMVTLMSGALTLVINPIANQQFQRQLFTILQTRAATGIKERVFNTTFGDVTIYVEDITPSQVGLTGLLVSDERDPKLTRIITAREGRLLTDAGTGRITLRLISGAVNEGDVAPAPPVVGVPDVPPPTGGAASPVRYRYTRFNIYDMNLAVESPLKGTQQGEKPERDLFLGDLHARINELAGDPIARTPFLVEWHKRLAFPAASLVFALVGFPLAVRSHRGGRSVALLGSLVIIVMYYLVLTSLEGMALRQRMEPWEAIWAPNIAFAGIGSGLLAWTAIERRPLRLTALWKLVDAVRRRLPRLPVRRLRFSPTEPRDSTHIIDRYLVREFLSFLVIGLSVATVLFFVIDLIQTLDRFLRVKPPLRYIAEHFLFRLPAFLHEGLPVIMLVATIFLFLTLSRYHELTALKAAGMSLYRVSAPILTLACLIAVGSGLFQETALPALNERGDEVDRVKIRGQLPRHLQSRTRLWLRSADTRFYRVELVAPGTQDLYGVTVLEIDREFRLVHRLDARRAHWTPRGWELSDGALREVSKDGRVESVRFTRTVVDLPEVIDDFVQVQKPPSAMSYRELREYVARLEAAGFQARKYLVDLYSKLSSPLENMIMVLIAIPFALQSPRGGRLFGIGLAIAIMATYLVLHYVALSFARADLLPPLLAAWTANIIFAGIGFMRFVNART